MKATARVLSRAPDGASISMLLFLFLVILAGLFLFYGMEIREMVYLGIN